MRRARAGGYTLIELLVSLSVFALVVVIAAAAYLSFIAYNREAQTSATIINSLSFSIDRIARDIRTGENYACPGGTCSSTGVPSLTFTDTAGCTVTYGLSGGAVSRNVSGGGSACDAEPTGAITDPSVTVSSLLFYVRGLDANDDTQPMATMVIQGTACVPNTDCTGNGLIPFDIQTSATERFPDIANAAGGTGETGDDGSGDTGDTGDEGTGGEVTVFLTSGSSWTVPNDWSNSDNTIEVIGGGGSNASTGGGGGAYAKKSNVSLTPGGSASYQVGNVASNNGDTWFSSTGTVLAKGGSGSSGGSASASVGDVKYAGGNGTFGSGGGAAGPHGAGGDGQGSNTDAGAGDAGYGGAGAHGFGNGANGTEWDASHGSGGGGGGAASAGGGSGGLYGAGASNAYGDGAQNGVSAPGLIVITYMSTSDSEPDGDGDSGDSGGPSDPAPTCTLSASPTSLANGQMTTLTWTSTNATSFSISPYVGSVTPASGGSTKYAQCGGPYTFTGTASGPGGQATCSSQSVTWTGHVCP